MASKKTEKNIALKLHKNQFCLIWKTEKVSFITTVKEIKDNCKTVDKYVTEEIVKSLFEYIYTSKN